MSGNKGPMKKPNGKPTPKALALRRWNCESIEDMRQLIETAERVINEEKQRLDPKCWKGKHKEGTKIKGGVRVNNCVPNKKSLVDKIYELVSGVVSEEHFIQIFEYATEKPFSAFVIDNHKETPKENKFKINWNTIIRIN
jgi:hypothetical protein